MNKIFFKRILAYMIDCIILFFAMLIINLFIPVSNNVNELNDKLTTLMNDYVSEKVTLDEFTKQSEDINYDIIKATYISSVAGIVVYILYFVVFQAYNNGQTFGKKLLHLQVQKENGSRLDINTLLVRSLIPYGLLVNFLLIIMILFTSKALFLNINNILSSVHMVVIFATVILMMVKSRGIHDYLARTKVEEI